MIHNVVQFGNILCMSFESFGELYFRPTFDAGAVRRCIAIVRAIQADCLARFHASLKVFKIILFGIKVFISFKNFKKFNIFGFIRIHTMRINILCGPIQ